MSVHSFASSLIQLRIGRADGQLAREGERETSRFQYPVLEIKANDDEAEQQSAAGPDGAREDRTDDTFDAEPSSFLPSGQPAGRSFFGPQSRHIR